MPTKPRYRTDEMNSQGTDALVLLQNTRLRDSRLQIQHELQAAPTI